VCERVASAGVAVAAMNVPNISGTVNKVSTRTRYSMGNDARSEECHAPAPGKSWRSAKTAPDGGCSQWNVA
jgi:hypothetical protein